MCFHLQRLRTTDSTWRPAVQVTVLCAQVLHKCRSCLLFTGFLPLHMFFRCDKPPCTVQPEPLYPVCVTLPWSPQLRTRCQVSHLVTPMLAAAAASAAWALLVQAAGLPGAGLRLAALAVRRAAVAPVLLALTSLTGHLHARQAPFPRSQRSVEALLGRLTIGGGNTRWLVS